MRVLGVEDKAEETRQQKEGDDRALEGVVPSSKPSPRPAASPQFLAAERPRTVRPPPHSMPQEEFSEETPLLLAASHPLPMDQREASVEEGDQPYPVAPFVDFSAVATSDVGALRQQVEALQAHVNMRVEVEKKLQVGGLATVALPFSASVNEPFCLGPQPFSLAWLFKRCFPLAAPWPVAGYQLCHAGSFGGIPQAEHG